MLLIEQRNSILRNDFFTSMKNEESYTCIALLKDLFFSINNVYSNVYNTLTYMITVFQKTNIVVKNQHFALANSQGLYGGKHRALANSQGLYGDKHRALENSQGLYGNKHFALANSQGQYGNKHRTLANSQGLYGNKHRALANSQGLYGNKHRVLANSQGLYGNKHRTFASSQKQYGDYCLVFANCLPQNKTKHREKKQSNINFLNNINKHFKII